MFVYTRVCVRISMSVSVYHVCINVYTHLYTCVQSFVLYMCLVSTYVVIPPIYVCALHTCLCIITDFYTLYTPTSTHIQVQTRTGRLYMHEYPLSRRSSTLIRLLASAISTSPQHRKQLRSGWEMALGVVLQPNS